MTHTFPSGPASAPMTVSFRSRELRCDATFYRSEAAEPAPCIVMAHGFGGVRSAVLPEIATAFAATGFQVFLFDYRYWGTSGGQPRGLVDLNAQRADYRAAIAHVRTLTCVDPTRVVAWGTSLSAGHVLEVAADDADLAAAVITNPYTDGRAAATIVLRTAGRRTACALLLRGIIDRIRRALGASPLRVDLVGEPGSRALITAAGAASSYRVVVPPDDHGRSPAVPARIVLDLPRDRPVTRAGSVRCPILVCVCDRDRIAPRGAAQAVARRAPLGHLQSYPVDHFGLFHEPWRSRVVRDQTDFLWNVLDPPRRTLGGPR